MPIRQSTNEKPAVMSESLLKWFYDELTRVAKKIDNATNFAINSKTSLSAHPPIQRRTGPQFTSPSTLPLGEFQHMVYQNVTQNEVGFDFTMAHALP